MHAHNFQTWFELKPGRVVFVPSPAARSLGKVICTKVRKRWKPHPTFYHLHRKGGHIAALRLHVGNTVFARLDLEHFYASVTRTKIARSLRRLGFAHKEAFDMAASSVVVTDGRKRLPYGFVQSMLLATLALEHSQLGRVLIGELPVGVRVSLYVDDLILSGSNQEELAAFIGHVEAAAQSCGFTFCTDKRMGPAGHIEAFNIKLATGGMSITEARMDELRALIAGAGPSVVDGVKQYVAAVNAAQVQAL